MTGPDSDGGDLDLDLRIEKLVQGGLGLARAADGRVVLVEAAAPGDRVLARPSERHRGWWRARIAQVLEPGPDRREPPCRLVGRCGGCDLQHLNEAAQLEAKRAILLESLRRIGKIEPTLPITMHAGEAWRYRRRAKVQVRPRRDGKTTVGFMARDGQSVVDVAACPVLTPGLEAEIGRLRTSPTARHGEVTLLEGEGGVGTTLEPVEVVIEVGGDRLLAAPGAFFQANAPLLDRLVACVLGHAGGGGLALDLFAGVGLFTLGLARSFAEVIAVEGNLRGLGLLEQNARAAGLPGVRAIGVAVERALADLVAEGVLPEVVVVDPPREGLSPDARRLLAQLAPRALVYVSCDPVALARDVKDLGLAIRALDLFDLFPQTHHLETVALLAPHALVT